MRDLFPGTRIPSVEREYFIQTLKVKKSQKKQIFVYMIPLGGQTAGPNGLTFFEETHG